MTTTMNASSNVLIRGGAGFTLGCAVLLFSSHTLACEELHESADHGMHTLMTLLSDHDVHTNAFVDGHSYSITSSNGETKVNINGREIPADQVKIESGTITFTDEDGEVHTLPFKVGDDMSRRQGLGFHVGSPLMWNSDTDVKGNVDLMFAPPKVMLGVQLAQPDKALASHLNIDPEESTMIVSVHDHLPAAKAGLKAHDIIVAVNGQTPADQDTIRSTISKFEAGDELTLDVISGGKKRTVEVKLDSFDQSRIADVTAQAMIRLVQPDGTFEFKLSPESLKDGVAQFFQFEPHNAEKFRDMIFDDKGHAFQRLDDVMHLYRKHADVPHDRKRHDADQDIDARLEQLDDRLSRLEDLLSKLVEQQAR